MASPVTAVGPAPSEWEVSGSEHSEAEPEQLKPKQTSQQDGAASPRMSEPRSGDDQLFDAEKASAADHSSDSSGMGCSEWSIAALFLVVAVLSVLHGLSCCGLIGNAPTSADSVAQDAAKDVEAKVAALVEKRFEEWKAQNPTVSDAEKTAHELEWLHVQHINGKADEILKVLASNAKKYAVVAEVFSDPRIKQDLVKFLKENHGGAGHASCKKDPSEVADLFVETSSVLAELKGELVANAKKHLTKKRNKKLIGACTYGSFFVGYCAYFYLNVKDVKKYYGMSDDDPKWDKAACYTIFFVGILFGAFCAMLTYLSYANEYAAELAEMEESLKGAKASV